MGRSRRIRRGQQRKLGWCWFGAGGGSDGAGTDGGAEDRCAGDRRSSRSSSSLNFRSESSSKLSSCCLVKPAMVMETIGLCSGPSVTVTHRNSSRFYSVDFLQSLAASMHRFSSACWKNSEAFASSGG